MSHKQRQTLKFLFYIIVPAACLLSSCVSPLVRADFVYGRFLGVMSHNSYDGFGNYAPEELAGKVYSTGAVSMELDVYQLGESLKVTHVAVELPGKYPLEAYLAGAFKYTNVDPSVQQPPQWKILIECKSGKDTIKTTKDIINLLGVNPRAITFCFHPLSGYTYKDMPAGYGLEGTQADLDNLDNLEQEHLDKITSFGVSWSNCTFSKTPAKYIAKAHSVGKPIAFWGVTHDNEETWKYLYYSGADLIRTDYPERCYKLIQTLGG
jgi:hypothetical protein